MTIESRVLRAPTRLSHWHDRFQRWRQSALLAADLLAVMVAASLPWSTSATSILVVLWVIVVAPIIDWETFLRDLAHPSHALPVLFVALAILGILWADGPWAARLHGIKPVAKLLMIPLFIYHFQRTQRASWVFIAFLASCTLLMTLSWIVLFVPSLKPARTLTAGVPVKNYIDQSQEFALCAFALALPALIALRRENWKLTAGYFALMLTFIANMLLVALARTALIYMAALLVLFAWRYLSRRSMLTLLAGAIVAASLVWASSPYLRQRIADIGVEYQAQDISGIASTAQRLTYWRKSMKFFAEAPLLGHGTGSIKAQFERDAIGRTGLDAEIVNNPHNQTLAVAVQWGAVGVILLYAIWLSHLLLFTRRTLAAWIGLVVVVQNVVSSLLNSHLFDFHEGWLYVVGVGVAGGTSLRGAVRRRGPLEAARS
ncbi:O-antigen ligase family protein [Bradyrhizobium sp. 200]|uniref:O-antigen ligase family protein n=1 Tax=Bradyrhizobium sp. 200 TaxID=2782665 RepID=UPI001FFF9B3C|nr:O-antigen ligase family protein [Bradyrhizobium sp. 200]UPJ46424.1 O-antigen ligase family protein [Bradyrhizobium sp. 200]